MTIKFKILEINQNENQIIVKYYDDIVTEDKVENRTTFAINLPIPTPTDKYLDEFILSKAPTQFFIDAEAIVNNGVDLSHIHKYVGKEKSGPNLQKEHIRRLAEIKYEIQEFHPESHAAIVKYFIDDISDAITKIVLLPLINGEHPDEIQTKKFIMGNAPVNELERAIIYKNSPPKIPKHLKPHVKK